MATEGLDGVLEGWADECEWRPAMAGAVEGSVYRGRAEIRRYLEDLFDTFAEVDTHDVELRDLGARVLVLYRLRARGHDSQLTIDQPGAILYELRGGQIVNGQSYLSWDEGLAAAAHGPASGPP